MKKMLTFRTLFAIVVVTLSTLVVSLPCGSKSTLEILTVNSTWLTPDTVFDAASGRLHVVYGTSNKDAYYTSYLNGIFSESIKLNTLGLGVTTTMGERGPKITMGADKRLIVVWADLWTGAGCRVYSRSTFSVDNGLSWSSPIQISNIFGIDGLSVAAGTYEVNMVVATFHVNTSQTTNATSATWLHYVVSLDGAVTWAEPSVVLLDDGNPAIACSMCMTRPRFDADTGTLLIGYRSAANNIRDFRVVTAKDARTNSFESTSVGPSWAIDYCPMNGPELSLNVPLQASDATETLAYMTNDENNVFFTSRPSGTQTFSQPIGTPRKEANERYPTAVTSRQGDIVMVYNVGPMAVSGDSAVKYACYAPGNSTASQSGVLGRSFAGTKATAIALGGEGPLLILTTAQ